MKPKFSNVEKIKTIGSTYMAASGLQPGREQAEYQRTHNVVTLVEFAISLMGLLDSINRESFQNFKLRIGIDHGPVIAGVVGATKPQYDIWGNTVNVASRMDSCGVTGRIQVTDKTAKLLEAAGYQLQCRGPIEVKGKGNLVTHLLISQYDPELSSRAVAPLNSPTPSNEDRGSCSDNTSTSTASAAATSTLHQANGFIATNREDQQCSVLVEGLSDAPAHFKRRTPKRSVSALSSLSHMLRRSHQQASAAADTGSVDGSLVNPSLTRNCFSYKSLRESLISKGHNRSIPETGEVGYVEQRGAITSTLDGYSNQAFMKSRGNGDSFSSDDSGEDHDSFQRSKSLHRLSYVPPATKHSSKVTLKNQKNMFSL